MENEIKKYLKHFGKNLITKEIEEYATEVALKHSRYMFIERRGKERYICDPLTEERKRIGKQQYGYCTYCNKEYETEGLEHNGEIVCPGCGSKVRIRSSGRGRKYMYDEAYFVYFEKSKINKDVIIAKGITATKNLEGDYKELSIKYYLKALYIFKIKNPVMLINQYWGNDLKNFRRTNTVYPVPIQSSNCYINTSLESLDKAIEGTPYQYSMYKEYLQNENVIRYLELYSKYPRIEDLTKLGFKEIVCAKLWKEQTYNSVNWNGETIFKMLRINRVQLKELMTFERRITPCFMRLYQLNIKEKNKLNLEELKYLEMHTEVNFDEFKKILRYTSLYKAKKYIKKQEDKYLKTFYRGFLGVIKDWRDYIEDCKTLEMDLQKESVLFPKDLYTAHQNTIKQVKYQANKLLDEKMKIREEVINEKYYFEDKDYLVRAVTSTKEIIDEGAALHHCVGGYAERHAKGETNILVIREKKKIDKPYYTIEIKNNRVVQVRGLRNCAPDNELNKFLDKFKALKIEKIKSKKIA